MLSHGLSVFLVYNSSSILCSWFAFPSTFPALPMPANPPSSRPGTGSNGELGHSPSPPSALRAPPGDVQLKGDGLLLHNPHHRNQSSLEIDHSLGTDLGTLVNLAGQLQQFLPPNYRWLGQGDLRVAGIRPIDAGGFADVWVGEMGEQKVAVKSYRCYASADHMPTYNVSYPHPSCVSRSSAIDR